MGVEQFYFKSSGDDFVSAVCVSSLSFLSITRTYLTKYVYGWVDKPDDERKADKTHLQG